VLPREGRILVEGGNMAKKHQRSTGRRSTSGQQLQQGGIIDTELPLSISNVQIVCRTCGQPTRVGHRLRPDGNKVRICRKCEGEL
jgi:large subunit ribosomal protein L24